ncbi:MAG: helix-turn-helix domain-containing protein [Gammaproteobacteria bacterium]
MSDSTVVSQTGPSHGVRQRERRKQPLRSCVQVSIENFFDDIGDHQPGDLYRMVISEVEQAMLASVMRYVNGNQSRAAEVLGINRSTLRKKLRCYKLN